MNYKYFDIRYDRADEAFAQTVAEKADRLYEDMLRNFGFRSDTADQKILLTICGSIPQYLEATGKAPEAYQEWMVGNSDFGHRRITILSPRVSTTHSAQALEKVFIHELIHMIFDIQTRAADAPLWCAEGVAILYADQIELEYAEEEGHPKIMELLDEETFPDRGGYDYAGVYVWYYIERFGFAEFLKLYRNSPAAVQPACGFELEAIRKLREKAHK